MRLHHVVYVSLLKPFNRRNGTHEDETLDKDETPDKDEYYTIEEIVDSEQFSSGVKYIIRWEGYFGTNRTFTN